MRTNEITREQISALADGELTDQQVDIALAALRQPDAQSDWEIYHQIGDVMRSDEMAITLSPGFAARMAARLDAEPAIVAPVASSCSEAAEGRSSKRSVKRWAIPSAAAAAAMATLAFFTTPQLMVALSGESAGDAASVSAVASSAREQGPLIAASSPDGGVVLRDARIDDYLLAHQRFSPSVYSTAQYARSATFSSETGK